MSYNIAIVGSTGAVGREMLETLSYRNFPCKNVYALASKSSLGKEVSFGEDKILKVQALEDFDFSKADIALFSAGSSVSASGSRPPVELKTRDSANRGIKFLY